MGVRELMRKNQPVAAALAVAAILGCGWIIYTQARAMMPAGPGKTYYSADDGQTVFVADTLQTGPLMKDGKRAYRAHVFECGGDRVVGYLSRLTDRAEAALAEARKYQGTGTPPPNVAELATVGTSGTEVRKPGANQPWVSQANMQAASQIRSFRCPDGSTPEEVVP